MIANKKILFLLILLFVFYGIFALESTQETTLTQGRQDENISETTSENSSWFPFNITERYLEAYLRGEYNRSFNYNGDFSFISFIEFENSVSIRSGLSLGRIGDSFDIKGFIRPRYTPFASLPLHFSVSYIYNGLPDYDVHTHNILPFVSFDADIAGISIGLNCRFTSFFGESAQFESILSFYGYYNFINSETLVLGIGCGTFSDFNARNLGAYTLKFYTSIRLDSNWSITSDIEIFQSGGDGLSTNLYGFAWRAGAKFTW